MQTSVGAITLSLPDDAAGALTAQSAGGSVVVDGLAFDGTNIGGAANGTFGGGGALAVTLQTTTADITVGGGF